MDDALAFFDVRVTGAEHAYALELYLAGGPGRTPKRNGRGDPQEQRASARCHALKTFSLTLFPAQGA